jgi:hypothetical protein
MSYTHSKHINTYISLNTEVVVNKFQMGTFSRMQLNQRISLGITGSRLKKYAQLRKTDGYSNDYKL